MKTATLTALLLLATAHSARAESAFFVGEASRLSKSKAVVPVSPGEKVRLDAEFFDLEDGAPPQALDDPEGTYEWHVQCEKGAPSCSEDVFEVTEGGRLFAVPANATTGTTVLVTHVRPDGTPDGQGEIDLLISHDPRGPHLEAESLSLHPAYVYHPRHGADEPSSFGPSSEDKNDGPRGGRHHGSDSTTSRVGGGGGGGGFGSSGSSSEASTSGRGSRGSGRSSDADSAFGQYYSELSYDRGGSSEPNTTARGYNRENAVPVLSCSNVPGADGAMHVVCEDESKELRVRAPAPRRVKKATAAKKKAAPKKVAQKKKAVF